MAQDALLVASPSERAHEITPGEISNLTSTRSKVSLSSGADVFRVSYSNLGSAVGKVLYVVFNATSDADANTKLGTAGQRFVVPLGGDRQFEFGPDILLTRVDVKTDVASETGSSLVYYEAGVLL